MIDRATTRLPKWPFVLGDACLLGVAAWIALEAQRPVSLWPATVCLAAVAIGAWLCVVPFLREHAANARAAEGQSLGDILGQMQNLESIQSNIATATGRWQEVQSQAERTIRSAREVADQVAEQTKEFNTFFQKAGDQEKNTLRLENEKLKRAEGEWLQVLVRLLDNVFALHQAGLRTGQQELIRELTQFQNACRDAARRVGLVPFVPSINDEFDARVHQTTDAKAESNPQGQISDVIAPGFTFQAQPLRRALVRLIPSAGASATKQDRDRETVGSVISTDETGSRLLDEPSEPASLI